jgi:DNA-directed RNA polymerase sigma subunit (sigma70/sigma32)
VICSRYGLQYDERTGRAAQMDEGATLESLAVKMGVSRERIRQIEREALRKMRRALGPNKK